MVKVADVMRRDPPTIESTRGVREAALLMASRQSGYLIVAERGRPVGVLTCMDVLSRAVAAGLDLDRAQVRAIMTQPVYTVRPEDELEGAASLMAKARVRRLAVVDESGSLVGALTLDDIAMHLARGKGHRDLLLNALCQYSEPPSGMPYL